jgi:uncharacterized protein YutE (UPF0331/DUF86 family)
MTITATLRRIGTIVYLVPTTSHWANWMDVDAIQHHGIIMPEKCMKHAKTWITAKMVKEFSEGNNKKVEKFFDTEKEYDEAPSRSEELERLNTLRNNLWHYFKPSPNDPKIIWDCKTVQ